MAHKIMLVDDEADILEILEMVIESEIDVNIVKANSGSNAIKTLEEQDDIQLIVSDYNMPNGNGATVFNYNKGKKNLPFIFVSGGYLEDYHDVENFFETNPANNYCSKPVDEEKLITSIRKALNGKLSEQNREEIAYKKIKIDYLIKFKIFQYDAYLLLGSEKYVKIAKSGDVESFRELEKYKDKGEFYAYISSSDFSNVITGLIDHVMRGASDSNSVVDSFYYSSLGIDIVSRGLKEIGVTDKQVSLVNTCVQSCVKNLRNDPHIYSLLDTFFKNEGYLISHSMTAIHVSYLIAKKMGIHSEDILEKFVYSGLLHDVTLGESHLSQVFDLTDRNYELLDWKTQKIIKEHPYLASDCMKKIQKIPQEVVNIVHEHHERADGSGFPRGLGGGRIQLLSAVFILSLRMAHFLFLDKIDKFGIEELVKDLDKRFSEGNFKKPLIALKEILREALINLS